MLYSIRESLSSADCTLAKRNEHVVVVATAAFGDRDKLQLGGKCYKRSIFYFSMYIAHSVFFAKRTFLFIHAFVYQTVEIFRYFHNSASLVALGIQNSA
jgi:hypothetical protein